MTAFNMLFAAAGVSRDPVLVAIAKNTASAATSITINKPTDTRNGDLMVAFVRAAGGTLNSIPTGWKAISYEAPAAWVIVYKYANDEGASYEFGGTASSNWAGFIATYRNAKIGWGSEAFTASAGGGACTATGLALPSTGGLVFSVFSNSASDANTYTTPTGTTAVDSSSTAGTVPDWALFVSTLTGAQTTPTYACTASPTTLAGAHHGTQFFIYSSDLAPTQPTPIGTAAANNTVPSTALVLNRPVGVAEGDLMYALIAVGAISLTISSSGWTQIATSTNGLRVFQKYAGASEPSTYTFTASATNVMSGAVAAYRNAAHDTISSVTTGAAAGGAINLPSITPGANFATLLAFAMHNQNSTWTIDQTYRYESLVSDVATAPNFAAWTYGPYGAQATESPNPDPSVASSNAYGIILSMIPA